MVFLYFFGVGFSHSSLLACSTEERWVGEGLTGLLGYEV